MTAKPRLKLERFDKKLLKLLEERGESTAEQLRAEFKILPLDFEKRLKTLARSKLVSVTPENNVSLGLKGYNALAEKPRTERKAREQPKTEAAPLQPLPEQELIPETQKILEEVDERSLIESRVFEIPAGARQTQQQSTETQLVRPKETDANDPLSPQVEAANLLVIPAPATQAPPQAAALPPRAQQLNTAWSRAKETCELCKAPFKLSLKQEENNPLYGHCFCGAAYHKDCYESLAQSGQCARCGRKLELKIDNASRAALKQLKNMFD